MLMEWVAGHLVLDQADHCGGGEFSTPSCTSPALSPDQASPRGLAPHPPTRPTQWAHTPIPLPRQASPGSFPCSNRRTRLVNQGLCMWGPRAANHICQSRRGW